MYAHMHASIEIDPQFNECELKSGKVRYAAWLDMYAFAIYLCTCTHGIYCATTTSLQSPSQLTVTQAVFVTILVQSFRMMCAATGQLLSCDSDMSGSPRPFAGYDYDGVPNHCSYTATVHEQVYLSLNWHGMWFQILFSDIGPSTTCGKQCHLKN